jgi:peptidoglycan glycosyltransferase
MNRQIASLFRLFAIAFAVLITLTAYWQIWAADSLATRRDNARLVYRQLQIKRGLIYASNGRTILASNHEKRRNGLTLFLRHYPYGPLFAHAVGYNTVGNGRTGIELAENDYLTASNSDLATVVSRIGSEIQGETVTGDNVVTSLSVPAQRAAEAGMAGKVGAVVAIEPATGRVLAMYSSPSFSPEQVGRNFPKLARTPGAPLLNRATQGLYAPGSTFKTVTAAAALDTGLYGPTSPLIDAKGHCITVQGLPLCNAGTESFGPITLTDALTFSVNTAFAQIGQQLGQATLERYMTRFGFFSDPPLTYPSDEMNPSGLYHNGHQLKPGAPVDVARVAIGQERLAVTPLQMAEVAATIGNGGERMRPTLVDRVVSPSGRRVYTQRPESLERVISPQAAQDLTGMMQKVVDEGTGTAAQLNGLTVAGKTGTAETGVAGVNTAWFIAFAPVADPKIAVAVVVEHTPLFGGQVAAPIAASVIEAYLGQGVAQ